MDKLQEFAKKFEQLLIEWKSIYKDVVFVPDVSADIFCPFIEDIKNIKENELKYIIVGDNPGKTEQARQFYFAGRTKYIRTFFESMLGKDWNKKVLFLNKTPIFTDETVDLSTRDTEALNNTQKAMAELIISLHKNLKECRLWILGDPKLKNAIFTPFWSIIKDVSNEQKERICHLKHPSYRGFANDILTTINEYKSMKGNIK